MMSIRKLTQFNKKNKGLVDSAKTNTQNPGLGFHPRTRFQKIRKVGFVAPKSSVEKIVFVSNSLGNGFKDQPIFDLPTHIPAQKMKDEVNRVCYDIWRMNRQHIESHAFAKEEKVAEIASYILSLIISILWGLILFCEYEETTLKSIVVIALLLTFLCVVGSIYTYRRENVEYDYDKSMIKAIKNQLAKFNRDQIESSLNEPRFQWTCGKDCLWITIRIYPNQ